MQHELRTTPIDWPETIDRGEPPSLAVWKFASCDGCQLSLLDCEDELMAVAGRVAISYFPEATTAMVAGPYDVSLVEGSITTEHDAARIRTIRSQSRLLVTIGACATAGGIQALRNGRDVDGFRSIVYAHPEYVRTLETSTPIAAHVPVDLELRGCPIDRGQLLQTLAALLNRHALRLPTTSVCVECKARGTTCVMVAHGTPCLGPVTQAGCQALCPSFHRGCYGCFGPMESPNIPALRHQLAALGLSGDGVDRLLHTFNTAAFAAIDVPIDLPVEQAQGQVSR
jgi:sulfhydrogenase subunit delta